mgnify:FL=1
MKRLLLFAFTLLLFSGCRKEPDLSQLSDDFLVATFFEKYTPFDSLNLHTYYISDTVGNISNKNNADTIIKPISTGVQLVNQIKSNLNSRGFNSVGLNNNPDVGINLFVIQDLNQSDVITPGYWWGYPGYYDPYYYGYYDSYYYYPFSYSYSYTTGTLVIEMIDLKHRDTNNGKLVVLWTGLANGILSDYTYQNIQNAKSAIDQAFTQSPYIKAN